MISIVFVQFDIFFLLRPLQRETKTSGCKRTFCFAWIYFYFLLTWPFSHKMFTYTQKHIFSCSTYFSTWFDKTKVLSNFIWKEIFPTFLNPICAQHKGPIPHGIGKISRMIASTFFNNCRCLSATRSLMPCNWIPREHFSQELSSMQYRPSLPFFKPQAKQDWHFGQVCVHPYCQLPSKMSVILQILEKEQPLHHSYTMSIMCGRNDSTYVSSSISSLASLLTRAILLAVSWKQTKRFL